jgi:hypothetical protein
MLKCKKYYNLNVNENAYHMSRCADVLTAQSQVLHFNILTSS